SKSGQDVMKLLAELSERGHTVLLITHAKEVAEHAHRLIEIRDGNILSDPGPAPISPTQQVFKRPIEPREGSRLADVLEAAKMAVRSLRANLFRSVLTLLGIVIGVASVIAMLAIGDGAKAVVVERISSMGSNLLLVRPGAPNQRGFSGTATLVVDDVKAINELPNVLAAIPEQNSSVTARFGDADTSTSVNGTSARFPLARQWQPALGTFFSEEDEESYAAVAVLGSTTAHALFGQQNPVGQFILINNLLFQVVGVMSDKGASPMGSDQDDIIFVPYSTSSLRLSGQRYLRNVTVAVEDTEHIDETQDAV